MILSQESKYSAERMIASLATWKNEIKELQNYWIGLQPKTLKDLALRYIYGILSIRTYWQKNKDSFQDLKSLINIDNQTGEVDLTTLTQDKIDSTLRKSRCGYYESKVMPIYRFLKMFPKHCNNYYINLKNVDTWQKSRNHTKELIFGLGFAKTSFAYELVEPFTLDVTCLDRHMLALYKLDPDMSLSNRHYYEIIENHWCDTCHKYGQFPFIIRCLYWDIVVHKQDNSKYWAECLRS